MKEKEIATFGFDHNDKHYVIKVFQVGFEYIVKPYLNNKEASHFSYFARENNILDWKNFYGSKPPYIRQVEIAKLDIMEGNGLRKNT